MIEFVSVINQLINPTCSCPAKLNDIAMRTSCYLPFPLKLTRDPSVELFLETSKRDIEPMPKQR
jgi:hypothetical protein